jgi:hypothetical protein
VTALALATLGQRLPERLADQRPVVAECVSRNTDSGWRSMVCRGWGIPLPHIATATKHAQCALFFSTSLNRMDVISS